MFIVVIGSALCIKVICVQVDVKYIRYVLFVILFWCIFHRLFNCYFLYFQILSSYSINNLSMSVFIFKEQTIWSELCLV